ncbi:hypothetical protein H4R35_007368 [Dimargaris xerosporica]|nr:hypothetical protein H4R35_007368 [Dimargaris xerosporica]
MAERRALLPTHSDSPYGATHIDVASNSDDSRSANSSSSTLYDPLGLLQCRKSPEELAEIRKIQGAKIFRFYQDQNDHIDDLLSTTAFNRVSGLSTPRGANPQSQEEKMLHKVRFAVNVSVLVNVVLFLIQLYAAVTSGSLSLFATMSDAFMDLMSSIILLVTSRAMAGKNRVKYPTGKARMETGGIIVFASLMATLSIQLIVESTKTLIAGEHHQRVTLFSVMSVVIALLSKFTLYMYCKALRKYPSARVLAQDHFNDLVVNSFGLTMCLLGDRMYWWLDPLGGILVALIIFRSWSSTALEHVILIVGRTADPVFLQKVTYIALTHDSRIKEIDTCRAYHLGHNLYVEVDIVMPPETCLRESHDVGESLQFKLESLENVERAFVHLDYESQHPPEHEGLPEP